MKFSYQFIKKLLPKVPSKIKFTEALNMHSFETENLAGDLLGIGLPPNRYSDAASHLGIAREAAVIFQQKFTSPIKTIINLPCGKGLLDVKIENPKLCSRYAARYFEIKKIEDSPRWLEKILQTCGLKPINSVVDLMNYAMLETGQPLHAFDADKLVTIDRKKGTKRIIVRKAKKGEKIETLDGQKFILDSTVLVIADIARPHAIAGVKGGQFSGVSKTTKRIIVEAANFDPASIYKTSRKLKLITDAGVRFSHGISPALVDWGLDLATTLLSRAGAKLLDSVDIYPRPASAEIIEFDPAKYENLIGVSVNLEKARAYFRLLGFETEPSKQKNRKSFLVRVPVWRMDIENIEDLAEEVVRLEGYNSLKPKPPLVSLLPAHEEDAVALKDKIRAILTDLELNEVFNPSFIGEKNLQEYERLLLSRPGAKPVEIENPSALDKKYLRPSLLPLLIGNVRENSRFFEDIRIFEIGKVFVSVRGEPKEKQALGIVLAAKKNPKLPLELKGVADELLNGLGVDDFSMRDLDGKISIESGRHVLGTIVHFDIEKHWSLALVEFDLEKIWEFTEEAKEFIPIKKFPAVIRDISVLISRDVRIGDVVEEIQYASPRLIENVDLIDEYVDEKLGGKQSLTFRIIFQAEDRTLTDSEVNHETEKIVAILKKKFKAEVR